MQHSIHISYIYIFWAAIEYTGTYGASANCCEYEETKSFVLLSSSIFTRSRFMFRYQFIKIDYSEIKRYKYNQISTPPLRNSGIFFVPVLLFYHLKNNKIENEARKSQVHSLP